MRIRLKIFPLHRHRMNRCYWQRQLKFAFLLTLALIFTTPSAVAENNTLLIVSNDHALHQQFITQLNSHLNASAGSKILTRVIHISAWRPEISTQYPLTLVLGNEAAHVLGQFKLDRPILYSLVPSNSFAQITKDTGKCQTGLCSAIYIDQPVSRTLALAHLALPNLKIAGVLTSQQTKMDLSNLKLAATAQGIRIEHRQLNNKNNLVFKLNDLLQNSDALLSLPDAEIYSSHTVQNILLTAYHYHKPVIGYSRAFVKAGALFAVYSSLVQLSQQTAETIQEFFDAGKGRLSLSHHPRYFSVSVNRRVAKSLDIDIEDEATLQEKLEALAHE